MHTSALHDTRTRATPTQLRAAADRTARLARIADAARLPAAAAPGIAIEYLEAQPKKASDVAPATDAYEVHRARGGSPLDARLTFTNLFLGACNSVPAAALHQVALSRSCDPVLYNPIYVHGGPGCGKTHLLQATAWEALAGKRRVLYTSADRFNGRLPQDFLAEVDILVVDDLQFVNGKVGHEEFGRALNMMVNAGRQVIVGCDRAIYDLEDFDDRATSRLASGLVVEAGALSHDVRSGIAERRIMALGVHLPGEVKDYLLKATVQGGRGIEGAVNRLAIHILNSSELMTVELAQTMLGDFIISKERRIKVEEIQMAVARRYRVARLDILSARRTANIVRPRQVAVYLSKTLTSRSLPEIGRLFGNRDHTTILSSVRKIERLRHEDAALNAEIETLTEQLRGENV
ncbi:chromosomal replication initiator protein DnaA [Bradyrhizobium sp. 156]|uniref:DnaA ATPase domain-containing protein n=1 Tax=Bradyrhizobium sp. 156 TaxID=2782630 RepID=UPI001FF7E509|nr:DnaA/Hda family protein [Bradyrhizobium sp. 156]MCK1322119.1 chromosomal replication initiator protein DnaA [Bradyrhizobium sp. 156]